MATKKAGKKTTKTQSTVEGSNDLVTLGGGTQDLAMMQEQGLFDVAIKDNDDDWGAGNDLLENAEIYQNDFLIPKLWLMQASSDLVKKRKVQIGDTVNSLTGKVICGQDGSVPFIVVKSFKRWQGFVIDEKGKKVYSKDHSAVMTLDNVNWKYEETQDGQEIKRRQVLSFIVILAEDVLANNPQPYIIDFAGASKAGGRKLVTSLKTSTSKVYEDNKGNKFKMPSAAFVYQMTFADMSFDDGDCVTKDVEYVGFSNKTAVNLAKEVHAFVKDHAGQIEYDDRDIVAEATETTTMHVNHKVSDNVGDTSAVM